MKKKPLRIVTCCMAGTLLVATPVPVYASPTAGITDYANAIVENELNHSTLASNISVSNKKNKQNNSTQNTKSIKNIKNTKKSAKTKKNSKGKTPEYSNMAVAQVNDYVNIRKEPNEDGELLGKLYSNAVATVLKKKGGWYKIRSGSVTGYVKGEFIVVGDEKLVKSVGTQVATVNTTTLKVRGRASKKAEVLTLVPDGEELAVSSMHKYKDGWVEVTIDDGTGFVSADYVEVTRQFAYAESKAEEEARIAAEQARLAAEEEQRRAEQEAAERAASGTSSGSGSSASSSGSSYSGSSSSSGQAVVNYATQFVGNPYVYGGSSLTNGTDCSGFVMSVYAHFGISLPHSSSALRSSGRSVSYDDRQPGDIICYDGHVAIYVGNNTIVHASNPATGIKYTSPANYRTVVAVRRIF